MAATTVRKTSLPGSAPGSPVSSDFSPEKEPLFDKVVASGDAAAATEGPTLLALPPPPDGGWGWVICLSSFLCNVILDGVCFTFGIMLGPLVQAFDSNRSTVSWVGSLLAGVYPMSGPIVGGLVNKFGCRPVCMTGAVVAALGLGLSIFSPNVYVLMVTFGVVGGFGLGLVYLPAIVAVGYYFEKKRALATGISVCGSGVGAFVFAPFSTFLLDQYGWRGTILIFAALCLNCAVFGALMRPLELTVRKVEVVAADPAALDNDDDDDDMINFGGTPSTSSRRGSRYTVQLPDGTVTRQNSVGGTAGAVEHHATDIGSMNLHTLPTITEQSVTATATAKPEKHASIMDVFPEVKIEKESTTVAAIAEEGQQPQQQQQQPMSTQTVLIKRPSRTRTISETNSSGSGSRFNIRPILSGSSAAAVGGGAGGGVSRKGTNSSTTSNRLVVREVMPRNRSTPYFVVNPAGGFPRNVSTPGFGRNHSSILIANSNQDLFGVDQSPRKDSGNSGRLNLQDSTEFTEISLQPGSTLASRRNSIFLRPMYRKDVFFGGSIMKLADKDQQIVRNQSQAAFSTVPTAINMSEAGGGSSRPPTRQQSSVHMVLGGTVSGVPSLAHLEDYRRNSLAKRGSFMASHLSIPASASGRNLSFILSPSGAVSGGGAGISGSGPLEADEGVKPVLEVLKEMVNLRLMTDPYFSLVLMSNLVAMLGFLVPFMYLPNMANERGVPEDDANFLLSIIGISNTLGRVLVGWVADFPFVDSLLVTNVSLAMLGLSVVILPFCATYPALVGVSLMFGFFVASYISITSILLVDLLGLDNLTSAFGLLAMFRGVSSVAGPPIAGALYDATHSYDTSFFVAGGCLFLASALSFGVQALKSIRTKKTADEL